MTTIVIPTDIDDPNGHGVAAFFDRHDISEERREATPRGEEIEAALWATVQARAGEALEALGYTVTLSRGPVGSDTYLDDCRRVGDQLAQLDEYPCDMAKVWADADADVAKRFGL